MEELFEVEGSIRGSIFRTQRDLGVAESVIRGRAISGGTAMAKSFFDSAAQDEANAVQIARDAGLMLAELPANFGESLLLGVVQTQTLFIARIESRESRVQRADDKRDVALAVRVSGRSGNTHQILSSAALRLIAIERFEAATGADGINVALGENGAEPGFQRAAAMEIAEEGAFAAVALLQPVEFGKERIREFRSLRRSGAAAQNRSSGGAQIAAIGAEEMLPRGFAIFDASGGKSQILEVQRGEIILEFLRGQTSACQDLLRAALERRGKACLREIPARGFGLGVEPFEFGGRHPGRVDRSGKAGGLPGLRAGWGLFLHQL